MWFVSCGISKVEELRERSQSYMDWHLDIRWLFKNVDRGPWPKAIIGSMEQMKIGSRTFRVDGISIKHG